LKRDSTQRRAIRVTHIASHARYHASRNSRIAQRDCAQYYILKKVKRAAKREEGRRRDVVLCAMASSCKAEAATASRLPQSGRLASIHSDPPADFTRAHRRSKTLAACSDVTSCSVRWHRVAKPKLQQRRGCHKAAVLQVFTATHLPTSHTRTGGRRRSRRAATSLRSSICACGFGEGAWSHWLMQDCATARRRRPLAANKLFVWRAP